LLRCHLNRLTNGVEGREIWWNVDVGVHLRTEGKGLISSPGVRKFAQCLQCGQGPAARVLANFGPTLQRQPNLSRLRAASSSESCTQSPIGLQHSSAGSALLWRTLTVAMNRFKSWYRPQRLTVKAARVTRPVH